MVFQMMSVIHIEERQQWMNKKIEWNGKREREGNESKRRNIRWELYKPHVRQCLSAKMHALKTFTRKQHTYTNTNTRHNNIVSISKNQFRKHSTLNSVSFSVSNPPKQTMLKLYNRMKMNCSTLIHSCHTLLQTIKKEMDPNHV